MALRLTLALLMLAVTIVVAGRRVGWLTRLIRSGQPAPGRTDRIGERLQAQLVEVFGQRRLLRWSVPGIAHFFTFWGFIVFAITIVEAFGALVISEDFAFPFFGHARWLGFLEDFFAVAVLVAIIIFAALRLWNAPDREHRASRFYGSHTGPAWVILGMITLVIVTLLLYRGAQYNTGHFPFGTSKAPFASYAVAQLLGDGAYNQGVETFFLLAQMAVIFGFTIIVVYSKHLHIAIAPLNVTTKRLPDGMGPLLPGGRREGRADRLLRCGEPERGHNVWPGKDRGLHLEGLSRLRDLHRVRALPVPVPGMEHRKAAVAEARDHGPARPPVRQGSLPHRREDSAGRRAGPRHSRRGSAVRFPSCPGGRLPAPRRLRPGSGAAPPGRRRRIVRRHRPRRAVVVHHVRGVRRAVPGRHRAHRPHRRHAPLPGAGRVGVPVRGRRHAAQPREQGQSLGPRRSRTRGVDRRTRLRGPARHPRREAASRHGLSVLGRLRRRAGGPVEEGHSRRGRAATRRRREVRHSRRWRNLHRRPGPAARQRVPVPDARHAERRDPQLDHPRRATEDRRDLPALFQHAGQRIPAARRPLRRACTTPNCSGGSSPTGDSPRSSRSTRRSPTTTRATSAGTTRSTRRRGRSSTRCRRSRRRRCIAARTAASAVAPVARVSGWRRRSASGSTSSAPRRRSVSTPT